MMVRELRRQLPEKVIVEQIGWTASGRPFANVISGELTLEDRGSIKVIRIHSTDLPEYFEFIGQPRVGFASIEQDRIFLDMRRETDPLIFEEAFEHETQHLLDRHLYGTISPADLEIRAMVRGLSRGNIPRINLDRLYFALRQGDPHYQLAAQKLLQALSLVILGREDLNALKDRNDSEITNAARALATLLRL